MEGILAKIGAGIVQLNVPKNDAAPAS